MMRRSGLTLLELLIAVALSSILALALYEVVTSQNRIYLVQDDAAEMQQNMRVALEKMTNQVRMAGFGKQSGWTDMSVYADTTGYPFASLNFSVYPSSGTATQLHLVGCLDSSVGTLSQAVASGGLTLRLASGQAGNFNLTTRSNISIGGKENARVTSINTGTDQLTIDTNLATTGNQGAVNNYAVGTEIFVVKWVSYTVDTSVTPPALVINEHEGAGNQQLALFINSMAVSVNGKMVDLTLNGITKSRDGKSISGRVTEKVLLRN
jgi:prepilin-type N-terminal cleavage/methylation domain-containing protein